MRIQQKPTDIAVQLLFHIVHYIERGVLTAAGATHLSLYDTKAQGLLHVSQLEHDVDLPHLLLRGERATDDALGGSR